MTGQIISHYKILEKLGGGGMGVVYKARDLKLDRFVALKFLPHHLIADDEEKKRFIHEAKSASALDHPNICTIYEIDETEDEQMFIAMAYYEGETLKKKIDRGPLPLDEAINLAIQVAQGLQCTHEAGITHRDIKPANVMITNKGQAKIMDFGLAKLAGQKTRLTKTGMTVGTLAYMSPEQLQGIDADHRSDIWALGVVLYEILTGKLPFKGEYEAAMVYSILNEPPEPIIALRAGVPMELERIVNKAVAKNTNARYQHIDEILVDLRSLQTDFASGASKQRLTAAKFSKKKRFYLYGGFATVLIFLIGIILFRGARETYPKHDSIAVLPITNLSGDPELEYFADGMTEALITDLAQISALKVISRTSVMQYKGAKKPLPEIANELKVDVVLEGSVQCFGERVKITAQLIEAATDRHLWAKSYERELRDILALQNEVARAVADEIQVKLTPQEQARLMSVHPVNPEAYQAYLKGRYYWNKRTKEGFKKGIDYFTTAIEIDPAYALAYAGLADCYNLLGNWGYLPPKETFPKAKVAAMKAIEIDERLAEAHTSLAFLSMFYDWDWLEAEREFKRAIELNPNYATAHQWYGEYLALVRGQFDQAIAEMKRAQELDPLSLTISANLGWVIYLSRQYEQAIEQLRKTLELDPSFVLAHLHLGWVYVQEARYEEAIAELQKVVTFSEDAGYALVSLGTAYALSGKKVEAQKVLKKLKGTSKQHYISPGHMAFVYIGLGEKDQAFAWLEKAYEKRDGWLVYLMDPCFDPLRSDPRFTELLKKVGLEK
jgi:serine/threonine-protein kinase